MRTLKILKQICDQQLICSRLLQNCLWNCCKAEHAKVRVAAEGIWHYRSRWVAGNRESRLRDAFWLWKCQSESWPKENQVKFKEIGLVLGNPKKMRVMRLMQIQELKWNVCVQRNQMWIDDGNWRRNWVCAFLPQKRTWSWMVLIIREKGTYPVEGWVPRNHPQLHAVIELSQLNPSVETFSPPQAAAGDTSTNGAANPTTCGVTVEATSVLRPGKVALQMVPVILEG